jgi:hypothetical protein
VQSCRRSDRTRKCLVSVPTIKSCWFRQGVVITIQQTVPINRVFDGCPVAVALYITVCMQDWSIESSRSSPFSIEFVSPSNVRTGTVEARPFCMGVSAPESPVRTINLAQSHKVFIIVASSVLYCIVMCGLEETCGRVVRRPDDAGVYGVQTICSSNYLRI